MNVVVNMFNVLGDDMERVTWRSKQALDFSFLMMYAKDRGTFYVQLEDDVLTKKVLVRKIIFNPLRACVL